MYCNFEYYISEYGGVRIKDEDTFNRLAKRADRVLDRLTGYKLSFAFPENSEAIDCVYQCECALVDFQFAVDQVVNSQAASVGSAELADGSIRGKIIGSISSGSESISYTNASAQDNLYVAAANNHNAYTNAAYNIACEWLSGVGDKNGVGLLYCGPYPEVL